MQYDESANGREVEIKIQQEFEIVLHETRTAGYRWSAVAKGEPTCELMEENIQPAPAVGGSGVHRWRFRGISPGNCEIALRYARPWENFSGPDQMFQLKVQVRP
jgi:predicted secreted protein